MKSMASAILCVLVATTWTSAARTASIDDLTPQLKSDTECMLRVLKSVPGIDDAEMGVSDTGDWLHPFLQYHAVAETNGFRATTRFEATRDFHSSSDQKTFFRALISGLAPPGEEPPDYGTGAMAKLWEKKCNVHVMVLFA